MLQSDSVLNLQWTASRAGELPELLWWLQEQHAFLLYQLFTVHDLCR